MNTFTLHISVLFGINKMHFSFRVNCFYFMRVLFHLSSSVHFWVVSRIETAAGDSAIPRFLRFLYICWKVVIRLQCKIPIEENSVFWKTFFFVLSSELCGSTHKPRVKSAHKIIPKSQETMNQKTVTESVCRHFWLIVQPSWQTKQV